MFAAQKPSSSHKIIEQLISFYLIEFYLRVQKNDLIAILLSEEIVQIIIVWKCDSYAV